MEDEPGEVQGLISGIVGIFERIVQKAPPATLSEADLIAKPEGVLSALASPRFETNAEACNLLGRALNGDFGEEKEAAARNILKNAHHTSASETVRNEAGKLLAFATMGEFGRRAGYVSDDTSLPAIRKYHTDMVGIGAAVMNYGDAGGVRKGRMYGTFIIEAEFGDEFVDYSRLMTLGYANRIRTSGNVEGEMEKLSGTRDLYIFPACAEEIAARSIVSWATRTPEYKLYEQSRQTDEKKVDMDELRMVEKVRALLKAEGRRTAIVNGRTLVSELQKVKARKLVG